MAFLKFVVILGLIVLTTSKSENQSQSSNTSDFNTKPTQIPIQNISDNPSEETTTTKNEYTNSKNPNYNTIKLNEEDFENLVYSFIKQYSEKKGKPVIWAGFVDEQTSEEIEIQSEHFNYDKPMTTVSFVTNFRITNYSEKISYDYSIFEERRTDILHNDNLKACFYNLKVPFSSEDYYLVTMNPSLKWSSWFQGFNQDINKINYWSRKDVLDIIGDKGEPVGLFDAILQSNDSLEIKWRGIRKNIVVSWNLHIYYYGNLIIALKDTNGEELHSVPIKNLANDKFRNVYDSLLFNVSGSTRYSYLDTVIPEAQSRPASERKMTYFSDGFMSIRPVE
ncbi:uncharacterized protein LOC111622117 [Centruroides sculpturatus]|uniref:uncharacterized protein LOC111622117 n=1 Tax=Centruroides sculpturatus TaxID=218467 RepID=UPI000C6D2DEE|nr:uncharacterized protein LOC111622117 [Centruroides sculpturatus]